MFTGICITFSANVTYDDALWFYEQFLSVNRVKFNFGATVIVNHPFEKDAVDILLANARKMIIEEEKKKAAGEDIEDWNKKDNKIKYLKPIPHTKQSVSKSDKKEDQNMAEVVDLICHMDVRTKTKNKGDKKELLPADATGKPDKKAGATVSRTCVIV